MRPEDIPTDQRPPSAGAWRFLLEQWDSGLFEVREDASGMYVATFTDDGEQVPFADMAYSHLYGLFRRSQMPDEPDWDPGTNGTGD